MSYTADDFRTARFAEHPDGRFAARIDHSHPFCWEAEGRQCHTDAGMAADGWVPVREADGDSQVAGRQKLLDHIASLEAIIRRRNDQIERLENQFEKADRQRSDLAEQVDELRGACAPVSLDVLRTAYEQAEQPTGDNPARPGDVVIGPMLGGGYEVYEKASWRLIPGQRVLSRKVREPHEDLADALWDEGVQAGTEDIARALHERGVRVTGGDGDD